ncbi:hypothetical protein MKX01_010853 [Papaver californicum]|nr:hypothetical protein MKX01_010853 [Papaver californicum]
MDEGLEAPRGPLFDIVCSRILSSDVVDFESIMRNTVIGHMEDLKSAVIGQIDDFKSRVNIPVEEIRFQLVDMNHTMVDNAERFTAENKAIVAKIIELQTFIELSKKKK